MTKKTVKLLIIWLSALLLAVSLFPVSANDDLYSSVIRIHILANSDSEEDQAEKLFVRDSVIRFAEKEFGGVSDISEAEEMISSSLDRIKGIADAALEKSGLGHTSTVSFGTEYYPTREYGALALPQGKYLSLKVNIGDAEGKNWWCVLFPPVCTNTAKDTVIVLKDSGMSDENVRTVTQDGKRFEVRFKLLEVFSSIGKKLGSLF